MSADFLIHLAGRLLAGLAFGAGLAGIYRATRSSAGITPSLPVTLILLVVLVAMVTQIIGESVARAFSLVGALSIIRFRTVVRDTQDTAYVIGAVALGMAVGQGSYVTGLIALAVIAGAAFLMRAWYPPPADTTLPYHLEVRLGLGQDAATVVRPTIDHYFDRCRVATIGTTRQGLSLDLSYRGSFRKGVAAEGLVTALNQVDGVQSVSLHRIDIEAE